MRTPRTQKAAAPWTLHHGEALAWLRSLPDGYADALVTDPPAGIAFMGKGWDRDKGGRTAWVAWLAEILREARRCLKPGAAGFAWALPRTSHWTATACEDAGFEVRDVLTHVQGQGFPKSKALLKPAAEHWIMVRVPGPLRELRIDECRVEMRPFDDGRRQRNNTTMGYGSRNVSPFSSGGAAGRWPANFAMSHGPTCTADACAEGCPVRVLGEQGGTSRSKASMRGERHGKVYGGGKGPSDTGTAARFFHCFAYEPKAHRRDRGASNHHPTVKPVALMRHLCRLVTPPGGLVLDPFAGSGTTGVAALAEGLRFAGCERDAAYAEIAKARLKHAHKEAAR